MTRQSLNKELMNELVAMAEQEIAAQKPITELMERDPSFSEWIKRALSVPGVPFTLEPWDNGDPPKELVTIYAILDQHQARFGEIVDEFGWPGRSLAGEDGADAAWLIAQHGDRDQSRRASWLPLLERAVAEGEADPRHLGRLTDRVAAVDRRPQVYGTYATLGKGGVIEWEIPPEGSESEVEARRARIGLPPLEVDLAEPKGAGPYRWLRTTPGLAWPPR